MPYTNQHPVPVAGSSSGWRGRAPMMDLDVEDDEWMGMPEYGQDGAPLPPNLRARRTAANLSRVTLNMLLIGVILVILAIPISIGLGRLAILNSQPTPLPQVGGTPVPTAPVPDGFTGYTAQLFSLAYPSIWQHHVTTQQLSDGTPAQDDSFTDGQGATAALYTTAGTADLLASHMDELATDTAVNSPLKPTALGATHTYNGTKWVESDYTFSGLVNGQPVQMQMRVLGAIHGAAAYLFVLTAPRSSFSATNSADFEPLLNSFRFD